MVLSFFILYFSCTSEHFYGIYYNYIIAKQRYEVPKLVFAGNQETDPGAISYHLGPLTRPPHSARYEDSVHFILIETEIFPLLL